MDTRENIQASKARPYAHIHRLDARTAGKIAAGEVVERPATVVKELIENAIDAGARHVTLEVEDGGKTTIRVIDDGTGIHPEDLPLVFERHATSKIKALDDIYETMTLGFRGEALASICAVSDVELITKIASEAMGRRVVARGGRMSSVDPVGAVEGTTLSVRHLFFNTPARLKFMKSNAAEARAITELISVLALSHPEIGFTYRLDDRRVFQSPGNGKLEDTIFAVFQGEMLRGMYPIQRSEGGLRLSGYVSKYTYTKGNRGHQFFFVNGRYVKNSLLTEVLNLAYKPYMMHNRHPVCVLFLDLPPRDIDVNIHPAKTEIKFNDDGAIKQFVYAALKKSFVIHDQTPKAVFNENKVFVRPVPTPAHDSLEAASPKAFAVEPPAVEPPVRSEAQEAVINREERPSPSWRPAAVRPDLEAVMSEFDFSEMTKFAESVAEDMAHAYVEDAAPPARPYDGLRYIGAFNATFLIYERDHALYIIDQHAAHEKVLFERFMAAYEAHGMHTQCLLLPEVVAMDFREMADFEAYAPALEALGFRAEIFGEREVILREIPALLTIGTAKAMLVTLLEEFDRLGTGASLDADTVHAVAEKACKAAIKGGDAMTLEEQGALIESLKQLKDPYTCPHGRPIMIEMTLRDLEKLFKRIV